jgi:glycosyltransferase involved in cell wall biosynthesis
MKVLLVVPWDQERGGVMNAVENLAVYLRSHGDSVLFLQPALPVILRTGKTFGGFTGVRLRLGFPNSPPRRVISTMMFPFLFPVVLIQLLWMLHKHRIEIVNLHFLNDRFFYFAVCRWLLPIKLVASVHGSDAFESGKPRRRYSLAFRFLVRSADLVILPSNAYRAKFAEVFRDARKKTICIHNGVDAEQFRDRVQAYDNSRRYILCIGALTEWKGIDLLLRAAPPLLREYPWLSLVIVGDGVLRRNLQDLATQLGIVDRTRFAGALSADAVALLLQGCDVLAVPSRAESFGLVVLEGMVCGKPVVASAVGGIPEIIENEISGILVEPESPEALCQAIRRVLSDDGLRDALGANGRARVLQRFCFSNTGAAYKSAFSECLHSTS